LTPVRSIARIPGGPEMLRLLSFAVFSCHLVDCCAARWRTEAAALLPAVLTAIVTEATSGALFFNLGVTLARVAFAFTLAMTLGHCHRLP